MRRREFIAVLGTTASWAKLQVTEQLTVAVDGGTDDIDRAYVWGRLCLTPSGHRLCIAAFEIMLIRAGAGEQSTAIGSSGG